MKLLIDGFGSAARPDFFKVLGDHGAEFCVFNSAYGRSYLLRNHQKLVIADDRIAIIGGANIDETYLTDEGPQRWRDLWLRIEGPKVVPASLYFDLCFAGQSGRMRSCGRCAGWFPNIANGADRCSGSSPAR